MIISIVASFVIFLIIFELGAAAGQIDKPRKPITAGVFLVNVFVAGLIIWLLLELIWRV